MNETQEFGACTSIFTEMRFIGMTADQSRELEEPIVAAACRHYFLQPDAVHVLGHRTLSVHDHDGTNFELFAELMTSDEFSKHSSGNLFLLNKVSTVGVLHLRIM